MLTLIIRKMTNLERDTTIYPLKWLQSKSQIILCLRENTEKQKPSGRLWDD